MVLGIPLFKKPPFGYRQFTIHCKIIENHGKVKPKNKKNDEFQLDDWKGRANKEQAHYAVMGRGIYIYIYNLMDKVFTSYGRSIHVRSTGRFVGIPMIGYHHHQ
jgi:hypothetical protein